MQQTAKYKFNIIETSDTFSPDALNANARAAETELARVEAAHAADKAALEAADKTLSQTVSSNKTALEQSIASTKTTLEQSIASTKSALEKTDAANKTALEQSISALKSTHTTDKAALDTAINALKTDVKPGSPGQIARLATGTYVGTGTSGPSKPNTLKFDFNPLLVFIASASEFMSHLMVRPGTRSIVYGGVNALVTWGTNSVSWNTDITGDAFIEYQCNTKGVTYTYLAIGVGK